MNAVLALLVLPQVQVREEARDWKVVASEHFDVYYPADELLSRARQFAGWFEEARVDLAKKTGVEPNRVHVFLYRSYHDLQQASFLATTKPLSTRVRGPALPEKRREPECCRPNPRSRALALAEPTRDRILIHCQPSDRWNYWFARHELAHHVQFAHLFPTRMPSWVIALRDPLTPWWFWEGGADYLADLFEPGKDQFMRDLAGERLYDLKELFFPDVINPYDFQAPYFEGSYFWRFLDEKYGPGTARKLFDAYGRGLALSMQLKLTQGTGRKREDLEREFGEHLRARWAPMLEGRGAPDDRLTDTRNYYRRRAYAGRWSPDGKHLAWIGNVDVYPELYVDGRGALGWRRLRDTGFVNSPPSWSPDSRRIAVVSWVTNRDDLLLVDIAGGRERIRLDFDELYDPAWSPDGSKIAFAALKHGTSDLYVLHLADRRVERLTEDPEGDFCPAWSPDGKRLAFVKETGGRTVLHLLGQGAVTKSWALLENPQWSPDGKSIVVAADVGGIFDAFAVDPATGAAKRLTKFRGGVSYPAYHPDGSLVVTYYQGRGQDLYRVRPRPQDAPDFDQEDRRPWYDQFRNPAPRGEPAEKSRVFGVNWLMFPVTSTSLLTPGVEFLFGDRDAENHLGVVASGLSGQSWGAAATVTNTRWRPTLGVTAFGGRFGDLAEAGVQPFIEVPISRTLTTGLGWFGRYREDRDDDLDEPHFFDSGPVASLLFSNQRGYQYRDPAWGFAFGGNAAYFSDDLGGDRELREYFGFVEASRDIVQDWILWSRATYEKKVGDEFLEDEILEIDDGVRGAEDLEGTDLGVVTVELRFPLWRDLLWKPMEFFGWGEFLIVQDLRAFAFGQAGAVGLDAGDLLDDDTAAASAGLGLRLDLSFMLWPVVNLRVPLRLEFWGAIVGQDEDDPRGAVGGGFVVGF